MNEGSREPVILLRIVYAGLDTDVLKMTVRLLVIQRIAFSGKTAGATHHRHAAKLTKVLTDTSLGCFVWTWRQVVQIDLRVARNEKVKPPVAIIITPT